MIVEQGEGARGDWMRSHFGTFVGILEDLLAVQSADPGFDPARPVEPAFVRLPPDVDSGTLIEDVLTARVADLTNCLYEVILQVLSRYYIHHGETAAELDTLARTAKHLMNWGEGNVAARTDLGVSRDRSRGGGVGGERGASADLGRLPRHPLPSGLGSCPADRVRAHPAGHGAVRGGRLPRGVLWGLLRRGRGTRAATAVSSALFGLWVRRGRRTCRPAARRPAGRRTGRSQ